MIAAAAAAREAGRLPASGCSPRAGDRRGMRADDRVSGSAPPPWAGTRATVGAKFPDRAVGARGDRARPRARARGCGWWRSARASGRSRTACWPPARRCGRSSATAICARCCGPSSGSRPALCAARGGRGALRLRGGGEGRRRRLPSIVGNLPYQLTGPLLFALLEHPRVTGPWVVMVQKEVADRLCAPPGSRDLRRGDRGDALAGAGVVASAGAAAASCRAEGRLGGDPPRPSLGAAWRGRPTRLGFNSWCELRFSSGARCLQQRADVAGGREAALRWCEVAGVDPGIRPERLGPEEFAALQRAREAEGGDAGAA
jgi:hypothetical protein